MVPRVEIDGLRRRSLDALHRLSVKQRSVAVYAVRKPSRRYVRKDAAVRRRERFRPDPIFYGKVTGSAYGRSVRGREGVAGTVEIRASDRGSERTERALVRIAVFRDGVSVRRGIHERIVLPSVSPVAVQEERNA